MALQKTLPAIQKWWPQDEVVSLAKDKLSLAIASDPCGGEE